MPSSHLAAAVAPERAIVLLSGGLDSSTALAMTVKEGREVHALTIDYGQRHRKEIEAAKKVAKHLGVRSHKVLRIDLADIAGSALTDKNVRVPTQRTLEEMGRGIPVTYVPARNTIFRKARNGGWKRTDLALTQRCYPEVEVRSALERAGFDVVRVFDGGRDLEPFRNVGRTFYLARTPAIPGPPP